MYRNQKMGVVRGGQVRDVRGRECRRRCDREMTGALIRATDHLPSQPSEGWYDMRRGRERWWGNLCRRIAELHACNTPKERVDLIPAVLQAYIDELYEQDQQQEKNAA